MELTNDRPSRMASSPNRRTTSCLKNRFFVQKSWSCSILVSSSPSWLFRSRYAHGTTTLLLRLRLLTCTQMVKLALRIAPHIEGRVHIQTEPWHAFSKEETITDALSTLKVAWHNQSVG